jgi:hypothetical protein
MLRRLRRPAFGPHGHKVVIGFCGWEIIALVLPQLLGEHQGPAIPTVSATVKRHPWFGYTLLALLAHHWYLED